jgi:glycosyltransferase involved in cell wall biosynthesis
MNSGGPLKKTSPSSGRNEATRPIKLGVPHSDYNTKRNILDSLPEGFARVQPWDTGRLMSAVRWRLSKSVRRREYFCFQTPFYPDVDLFHFWNSVASVHRPWLTTFEHTVPLWDTSNSSDVATGMRLALRDECRKLIAFSQSALRAASEEWRRVLPGAQADQLVAKVEVMLPPQPVLCAHRDVRRDDRTAFAFIGKEFYRKGGLETLEALARLWDGGRRDWRAVIVSDLNSYGDYASRTDRRHRHRAQELLVRLADVVDFVPTPVPNQKVINFLLQADFCLLPTYADTFGYTALEAQACGAIVVATDIGSLPELVSETTGVVIPLQEYLEGWRLPSRNSELVKVAFCERVYQRIRECLDMPPDRRADLRNAATLQLQERHCPKRHSHRLRELYDEALTS